MESWPIKVNRRRPHLGIRERLLRPASKSLLLLLLLTLELWAMEESRGKGLTETLASIDAPKFSWKKVETGIFFKTVPSTVTLLTYCSVLGCISY